MPLVSSYVTREEGDERDTAEGKEKGGTDANGTEVSELWIYTFLPRRSELLERVTGTHATLRSTEDRLRAPWHQSRFPSSSWWEAGAPEGPDLLISAPKWQKVSPWDSKTRSRAAGKRRSLTHTH